ncbi:DNA primase large subunit-like [Adelges cooleyi]|uniref:DNA primase large subunit-like n=1 Tax=Adelges cooleyi TaxID=133065 RepID=UPI00218033DC|nr:DNA primase large subunit-like [Adelges cooleyi]XP_050440715.1 DNA primase large subunit-like [Adelges cooleyi]
MFYLHVPDINISIIEVEDSSLARLIHFVTYGKLSEKPKHIEYLKNSSLLDYVGFLSLRTHASLTKDPDLKETIIEGECNLIAERLRLLTPKYLRKYLIQIIDDIKCLNKTDDNIDVLLKVCEQYKDKQHEPCGDNCDLEHITVPWQKCLSLMTEYKVFITKGHACVPCKFWNGLLRDLFRLIYYKSLYQIRRCCSTLPESDLRLDYITNRIDMFYNSKVAFWRNNIENVTFEELNINRHLLPPCMSLSLDSLFSNHRLAHDSRYLLTLFLKNIGVPIEQTLEMFKQQYSMIDNQGSTCTHTWNEHHKQIIYNVKHTYGMVGSKKNYNMQSCSFIQKQNSSQLSEEGGCPFVHCSGDKLKKILEKNTTFDNTEIKVINELRNSDRPIEACHWYAQKLFKKTTYLCHSTPVQYYFNFKMGTRRHISLNQ